MRKIIIIFVIYILSSACKLSAFDNLLFKPLEANQLEARISSFYQIENDKLRLDIGHSLDLYEFNMLDANIKIRLGSDFFILSCLRSEGKMKFPVETADYFFGVNASSLFKIFDIPFETRLRLAHISSHLIDGYSENDIFFKSPFVYSREFAELVIALKMKYLRPYSGLTYVFSTLPKDVNKFVPQVGFDFHIPFCKFFSLRGGYDLKIIGGDTLKNIACSAMQCGLGFTTSRNIEISLNYYFYSGYSVHGMFYDTKNYYNGLGFQINY